MRRLFFGVGTLAIVTYVGLHFFQLHHEESNGPGTAFRRDSGFPPPRPPLPETYRLGPSPSPLSKLPMKFKGKRDLLESSRPRKHKKRSVPVDLNQEQTVVSVTLDKVAEKSEDPRFAPITYPTFRRDRTSKSVSPQAQRWVRGVSGPNAQVRVYETAEAGACSPTSLGYCEKRDVRSAHFTGVVVATDKLAGGHAADTFEGEIKQGHCVQATPALYLE